MRNYETTDRLEAYRRIVEKLLFMSIKSRVKRISWFIVVIVGARSIKDKGLIDDNRDELGDDRRVETFHDKGGSDAQGGKVIGGFMRLLPPSPSSRSLIMISGEGSMTDVMNNDRVEVTDNEKKYL